MTALLHHAPRRLVLVAGVALSLALAGPASAGSSTFTDRVRVDVTGDIVDAGCPEPIEMSGSLNAVLHVTERANGTFSIVESSSAAGITGVGLTTGATYIGVGSTTFSSTQGGTAETFTFVDRTRLVGTGGSVTLDIRTTFHLTTVNGEVVTIVDRSSITCA